MKNNYSKLLSEKFGEPIGDVPGITTVGAVGVRSDNLEEACLGCGMINCNCDHSSGNDERMICSGCGMMVVDGSCGCNHDDVKTCKGCGMIPLNNSCNCVMGESTKTCSQCGMNEGMCQCGMNQAQKKGPSKKTAKKILRGTKTFAQKMKKVSGWAEDPAAAAAWMTHKATGKWPSEK